MLLDMKLIKTEEMFCFESSAATIATWLNRNYEMMYSKMLGFNFLYINTENTIGTNINCGYSDKDIYEMLEKYHGIRTEFNSYEEKIPISQVIMNELEKHMPVAISLDEVHCPWVKFIDISKRYILIIGYEDNYFSCYDVHEGTSNIKRLPFSIVDIFFPQDNEYYITYKVISEENKNITTDSLIEIFKKSDYVKKNTFEEMMYLADCIENKLDFAHEELSIKNPYFMPIFLNLTHILRARKLMSYSFDYIYKITNDPIAHKLSVEFMTLGGDWKLIWLMLQKSYNIEDNLKSKKEKNKSIFIKVADKLRKLAYKEFEYIGNLCNGTLDNNYEYQTFNNNITDKFVDNIYDLDIYKYCNNKAFSSTIDNKERADFTGHNEFFLMDKLIYDINFLVHGIPIKFKINNQNDNISCIGQTITLLPGKYKRILITGCAEWGSGEGYINVVFNDNYVKKLVLNMQDWYYIDDNYNIWIGNAIDYTGSLCKRALFSYLYTLDVARVSEKLLLPDNQNIHIFSIQLLY